MIRELTSLRFLLIISIFVHHLGVYMGGGSLGVAFFFVLSGFSLTLGYGDKILKPEFSYKKFISKRLIKFYPIHWLCLLLVIPIVLIEGKWITSAVCLNAALLQTWIPYSNYYFSYNSVSWYLADTVFLALLFPFLCRFIEKLTAKNRIYFVVVFAILYTSLQIVLYPHDVYAFIYINPLSRIPDFIVGILLALTYKSIKDSVDNEIIANIVDKYNIWLLLGCISAIAGMVWVSIVLTAHQTSMAFFYWPFIIVIIMTAAFLGLGSMNNILRSKVLVSLGSISFEFYMIHQLVIRYCRYIVEDIWNMSCVLLIGCISFAITISLSYFVNQYFEKPIINRLCVNYH